jgi:hypothetical protein
LRQNFRNPDDLFVLAFRIFSVECLVSLVDEPQPGLGLVLLQGPDVEDIVVVEAGKSGGADVAGCTTEPPFSGRPNCETFLCCYFSFII